MIAIDAKRKSLGGFEVGRLLPQVARRAVGPFVFLDHMGPVEFAAGIPREVDVRPHPHIGLSTLTWLFAGEIMHRDSVGSAQPVLPGEVNWMTAGRGVTHSERFERARAEGGPLHGLQAWIALPEADEEIAPSFHHFGAADLPAFADTGILGTLVAGDAYGLRSPVPVHSPLHYVELRVEAGAAIPLPERGERGLYVVEGEVEAGGERAGVGRMLVFAPGARAAVRATQASRVVALGGESLGPRFIDWNFVSSRRERIDQAKADWRAGRMRLPDLDDREFIPLPPEPGTPPNPMS